MPRFFASLAERLEKGMPLDRALALEAARSGRRKARLQGMARAVKRGQRFSQAMQESRLFSAEQSSLVELAEGENQLPEGLRMLAKLKEESRRLPRRFLRALRWVIVLLYGAILIFPLPFSFIEELGIRSYWGITLPVVALTSLGLWGLCRILGQFALPPFAAAVARTARWSDLAETFSLARQAQCLASGLEAGLKPTTLFQIAGSLSSGGLPTPFERAEQTEPLARFLEHPEFRLDRCEDLEEVRKTLLERADSLEQSLIPRLQKRLMGPVALLLLLMVALGRFEMTPHVRQMTEESAQRLQELQKERPSSLRDEEAE